MSTTVCVAAYDVLAYPRGGGHLWAYLNWALGFRELGCEVVWMERTPLCGDELERARAQLEARLEPYRLQRVVLIGPDEVPDADVLVSFDYRLPQSLVSRFERSILVNVDPGLLEGWLAAGVLAAARYHACVTTAEHGPDGSWQLARPVVALGSWPVVPPPVDARFTTVTHWSGEEWYGDGESGFANNKRDGFAPFLELPASCPGASFELAIGAVDEEDRRELEPRGWRVSDAHAVAGTPWGYQTYVQGSLAEFSCAKPAYQRLRTAWVSDRTVCYLASGRPAVVEDTGPSAYLPSDEGLLRFSTLDGAVRAVRAVLADPDGHSQAARRLAEERFAAERVLADVLGRVSA